jgi:uncharacterized protein with HEPN domain
MIMPMKRDEIIQKLKERDYQRFAGDLRTFHAITLCLKIISEVSRRVPEEHEGTVSLDPVAADGCRR